MTETEVQNALAHKFSFEKGYIYITEMSTYGLSGEGENRRIDGLVIPTYASQGNWRMAIEIKVSRADLIHELQDPAKSDAIFNHVEKFCIAIPNYDVAIGLDIPEHWGIMIVKPNRITYKQLPIFNKTALIDTSVLSTIIGRLQRMHNDELLQLEAKFSGDIEEIIKERVSKKLEQSYESVPYYEKELKTLRERVDSFTSASGIGITYNKPEDLKEIGELVSKIRSGYLPISEYSLKELEKSIKLFKEVSNKVKSMREDN